MPLVDINGVNVTFPFTPYPCQVTYMQKVVESLKTKQNAILESPTGTGKTLCLLCSCLAWLEGAKAHAEFKKQLNASTLVKDVTMGNRTRLDMFARSLEGATGSSLTWGGFDFAVPKIIYSSRTHSQLTQAIQELKRTTYNSVKVSLIGSREQLCLNETVKREANNVAKVNMCKAKVAIHACHYYNNFDSAKKNGNLRAAVGNIADMEDLMKFGEKHKICPYYAARELKSDADINFMPYNYILDPKSRKAHNVELQGNVVIFDEAHNLEKICEESSSFDLASTDIATAIEEVNALSEKLVQYIEGEVDAGFDDSSQSTPGPEFTLDDLLRLKGTLKSLEETVDAFEIKSGDSGITKPGLFIYELLANINLTFETKNMILELLDKVIGYLTADDTSAVLNTKGRGLSKISDILRIVFSREPQGGRSLHEHQEMLAQSYKVHIAHKEEYKSKKAASSWATTVQNDKPNKVLSYWCFSPGHTMKDLASHGVHSIILTSGTLSPLSSFTAEMQIPFPLELENPHVIEKHQMWIGAIASGPDNARLNSTYQFRDTDTYKASLGRTILNLSRVIPSGLLVFFPSYPVMDRCAQFWQGPCEIWQKISSVKAIFVEPRNKDDFSKAMVDYYDRINDPESRGAIFMAVCRGKVSEGLDFADRNGRAVVITGLPYPPKMDPRIVLKMQYLNEMARQPRASGIEVLTGNDWYKQQASRAVNQAVGRVIRHKSDYGAIILCDDRFLNNDALIQLPKWIVPHALKFPKFAPVVKQIKDFFDVAFKKMPNVGFKDKKPISETKMGGVGEFLLHKSRSVGTRVHVVSACVVSDHVPSLAGELTELKGQYSGVVCNNKRKTLLDALKSNETGKVNIKTSPQMPLFAVTQDLVKTPDASKNLTRKKIIVKRSSSEATRESVSVQPSHHLTASQYIQQVKSLLSLEAYKRFSSCLVDYKKFSGFTEMMTIMADLFTQTTALYPLLRDFYSFVKCEHKKQYSETCHSITGLDCGYKPGHSVSKHGCHKHQTTSDTLIDNPGKRPRLEDIPELNPKAVKTLGLQGDVSQENRVPDVQTHADRTGSDAHTEGILTCSKPLVTASESVGEVQDKPAACSAVDGRDHMDTAHRPIIRHLHQKEYSRLCCVCHKECKQPVVSQCKHLACAHCWKNVFETNKLCPQCNVRVRAKNMTKVFFPLR